MQGLLLLFTGLYIDRLVTRCVLGTLCTAAEEAIAPAWRPVCSCCMHTKTP